MTESKKLSIVPFRCPVCGVDTNYVYKIEAETEGGLEHSTWYRCTCGVVFQDQLPNDNDIYNKDYAKIYGTGEKNQARGIHAARMYAPIIEELTYGRMMLDVGFGTLHNLKFFEDRGWLTWGIDKHDGVKPGKNIYKGDFMAYNFNLPLHTKSLKELIGTDKIKKRTFNLIWMAHILEHFPDPLMALRKAYDLLSDDGVLYIATPDIDFVYKTGVGGWPHWKKKEHYVLWNEASLRREVERLGFKVVMSRRNFSARFTSWWDIHLICQKNYF